MMVGGLVVGFWLLLHVVGAMRGYSALEEVDFPLQVVNGAVAIRGVATSMDMSASVQVSCTSTTFSVTVAPVTETCSPGPQLCTGDATLSGHETQLTYICAQPTSSAPRRLSTVFITVTEMVTVAPSKTVVVPITSSTGADNVVTVIDTSVIMSIITSLPTSSSSVSMPPATVQATSTSTKTITVYRPTPVAPVSSMTSSSSDCSRFTSISTSSSEYVLQTDLISSSTVGGSHTTGLDFNWTYPTAPHGHAASVTATLFAPGAETVVPGKKTSQGINVKGRLVALVLGLMVPLVLS